MKKKLLGGFTLIEMAVVLVIAGALLGAGLKILSAQAERAAVETTKKKQEAIKQALINYLGKMGRLPCPDQNATPDGRDNADRGAAPPFQCLSYVGAIPYIDLGLDRDTVLDGWDNYMVYILSPGWQNSYNPTITDSYRTSIATDAFWPGVRPGQITVYDRSPASSSTPTKVADPITGTADAVVIISYGKNGFGAKTTANTFNIVPPGADEAANATITGLSVNKREYTEEDAGFGAFDDVVLPISEDEIVAPLIKSGALEDVSSSARMIQANDYVIAQILATKSLCLSAPAVCSSGYFYTIPNIINVSSFPAKIQPWTPIYIRGSAADYIYSGKSPITPDVAYEISLSDGSKRIVGEQELIGIIGRISGYI
jgi:prepilin-type N-terminal cleavage/methylation domain-containing protein